MRTYMNARVKNVFSLPKVHLVSPKIPKPNYDWHVCLGS